MQFSPTTLLRGILLFTAICCVRIHPAYSATPLPSQFYSPEDTSAFTYLNQITFVISSSNQLGQAVRTTLLANKRQAAGIDTVLLFENSAVTLPILQGIPHGILTTYSGRLYCSPHNTPPKCPVSVEDYIPPLIPDVQIANAKEIYLPLLERLLVEHARLGGKIALCACCNRKPEERIIYLPKQIPHDKLKHLKKQMKIKEGAY
ncbi:hypothetical protein [Halodesulfovibrio spirochaetisodalis]|uniref:Uncharacterized protein n=1 Tax=Halodesulfovibrio spirochaetisodalis TaxID=1560234 RepID=A0A1B7XCP2_9BACT|nr:hypothetical protein [Halodesulfovibrio spirochaetisodalis]OBQ51725.1 hypothetical protein SP90_08970 [Halodesulfovibrio spirochaetisodalis]